MVRLYSHCSCRYLTLLLVKWAVCICKFCIFGGSFVFPRGSRRCTVTAARPQKHGGIPHLRRNDVRARGWPDGSSALQYARRTNIQVKRNRVCATFYVASVIKFIFRIKSPPVNGCIIICGTVVTLSIRVYPSCHIQLGSRVWSARLLRIQLVWITSTQATVYCSLAGYSTQSVPFCKERRSHHRTWLSMVS